MLTWIKNFFSSSDVPAIEAAAQAPVVPRDAMAWKREGDALLDQGKLNDAAECYRQALALDPVDAKVYRTLGLVLKEQGRDDEAEEYLRKALALDASMADARHALGAIYREQGRLDESVAEFQTALNIDPDLAEAYRDLGRALFLQGKMDQARQTLLAGMARRPEVHELPNYMGNICVQEELYEQALEYYRQALSIKPDYLEAHYNRGVALCSLDRHEEAITEFDEVLALKPDHTAALNNRGAVLQKLKRHAEAIVSLDLSLQHQPNDIDALNNRAVALHSLKRYDEALATCERALEIAPDNITALYNRSIAAFHLNLHEEVIAFSDRILQLEPDNADAHTLKGNGFRGLNRDEEALACYDRALEIDPRHTSALNNRGIMLNDLKRLDEALACFIQAQQLKSETEFPDPYYNEGMTRLLLGELEQGWQRYEFRWAVNQFNPEKHLFPQPLWLGTESLEGKTILLYSEQGLGDTLQFCRYAPLVAERGAKVMLLVQPPIAPLLVDLPGMHMVYARGEAVLPFDFHCPLLSLPLAFRTTLDTIPANVPYLHADPDRVALWRKRLGPRTRPRIGLVWSGNPIHANDRNRSIPLMELARIVSPHAEFFSLHKEIRPADHAVLEQRGDIRFVGDDIDDFADTAAIIELMDLVVSVDTSVAHLAGAMGKPLWILLPYNPDWRWLLDRSDSPWYPSAKLFRQIEMGRWDTALDHLADEVETFIGKKVTEGFPPNR